MSDKNKKKRYRKNLLGKSIPKVIKYIRSIGLDEMKGIKFFSHISDICTEDKPAIFEYLDFNGELRSRNVYGIRADEGFRDDMFNEGHKCSTIEIVYEDGTSEYGFRFWDTKDIKYDTKFISPIYVLDGYLNESTGEIYDLFDYSSDRRIPMWLLKKLPMYNEKRIESNTNTKDGFNILKNLINYSSNFCTTELRVRYSKPIDGLSSPIAWSHTTIPDTDYRVSRVTWNSEYRTEEYAVKSLESKDAIASWSYLKSIYKNKRINRNVYGIIPASDLLSINIKVNSSYGKQEYIELWNNLDSTVRGEF